MAVPRADQDTMSLISSLLLVLLAVAASSAAGDGEGKLKHIHLYMHETFSGAPNATVGVVVPSHLGGNATFGAVAAFDDELRAGRSRNSSLVARYQGVVVSTGLAEGKASQGHLTVASILFVAGKYDGSVLSVEGPFLGIEGTIERSIVGGSGKFRMARGYYLFKLLDLTSTSFVAQLDLYVLTCSQSYM